MSQRFYRPKWQKGLILLWRHSLGRAQHAVEWSKAKLYFKWYGIDVHADWMIEDLPMIWRAEGSVLSIGKRFSIRNKEGGNPAGIIQRCHLSTLAADAQLIIGDDVGISGCTITTLEKIIIGDRVMIGTGAIIADNDYHPRDPQMRQDSPLAIDSAPVIVKNDAFIGARAMILKGVTIGEGATVGAGAIVTKDVPDHAVVAGNPARIVARIES